jgi:hypothetical protein
MHLIQSSRHLDPALSMVKTLINKPANNTTPALFACACLLVVHSFGIGALEPPADPVGSLLGIIQLVRGVSAVLRSAWDTPYSVHLSPLFPLVAVGMQETVRGNLIEITRIKQEVAAFSQFDVPFAERSTCLEALDHLEAVLLKVRASRDEEQENVLTILFAWPAMISEQFVSLVTQRRQVPLAIIACFAGRLRMFGGCWWLKGWEGGLFQQVEGMISQGLRECLRGVGSEADSAATMG